MVISQPPGLTSSNLISEIARYCLIIVPITTSILIAGSIKLDKSSNWLLLKGASETLKSEIYYFLTQTGKDKDKDPTDLKDSIRKLIEQVKIIQDSFNGTPVHKTSFRPFEGDDSDRSKHKNNTSSEGDFPEDDSKSSESPPKDDSKSSESPLKVNTQLPELSSLEIQPNSKAPFLCPKMYKSKRIEQQFKFYRSEAKGLSIQLEILRWIIYILGGVSTFLATIPSSQAWVAVSSTLVGTVTSYLELIRMEPTLINYNQAADLLYRNLLAWESSGAENDTETFKNLVRDTEQVIQRVSSSFVQDMQNLSKEGGSASSTRSTL
ncbi:hypothetical protein C7B82_02865 [Stenomitos frigidus ULC18]|uniref:SMODS and SLOG-associating 2TM effector domain-containing protein n=1 Tax=Stenomitos frigidus ULC18 TaxID=2107698 RepID=A0A2T1ENU8_9CYAN|nr:hypothetical protein C7B82_02865 [Stenomitos frigidus ULC18]